jgi:hypothetical protein
LVARRQPVGFHRTERIIMKDTYTLLIYENVPESTSLYLIPDNEADKYREVLRGAHNKFINSDDDDRNENMGILSAMLAKKKEFVEAVHLKHACLLSGYEVSTDRPIVGKQITVVYFSGFIL